MEISDELIDRLSKLARLRFAGEDREHIREDFRKMLEFVEKVQELDTEGVEPLMHPTQEINRTRPDEPQQTITHEEALRNAPKKDSDYFRVPKFVENK